MCSDNMNARKSYTKQILEMQRDSKYRREDECMANYQYMMSADDVARELNCSKSHAYKLVKSMNEELASQGYITMAGRIPRAYWAKKCMATNYQ